MRRFIYFKADVACASEARQISPEAVAQIHHGVDAKIFREPARFGNTRSEFEMMTAERSTEATGHEKLVVRFPARTTDQSRLLDESSEGDRDDSGTFDVAGFAANNRHIERAPRFLDSPIERPHPG